MPSSPKAERCPDPFAHRLLRWWDRHGRKDLPWQHPRTPYRVWISEIMLQQTQVATVIPYFERWMTRFPDMAVLAAAPEDEVLSLWSGLGYYARARNLQKAARACVTRHGGRLPDSAEELRQLPGIGPSTANAIVSLAFDRPAAILDGNVKRVLARHLGVEGWPGDAKTHRELEKEAEARLPGTRAADYSQAIMDLGATVCTRRSPDCGHCPVSSDCIALSLDAAGRIPASRPRSSIAERTLHLLIVRDGEGRVLLERRPPSGIWGGLWSLPEGSTPAEARAQLGLAETTQGVTTHDLPEFSHRLTHLRLQIRPALMTVPANMTPKFSTLRESANREWFGPEARRNLGLPRPVDELLQSLDL